MTTAGGVNVSKAAVQLRGNDHKENVQIIDEIIKSENDSMEYRLISLENGLKAILVSDVKNLIEKIEVSTDKEPEEEATVKERPIKTISDEEDMKKAKEIGEPEEKMAACALCIGVGSFSDPPDIPGLAHFLEHMVFMGSSKYPKENGFDEFIKKCGGSDNGATECETTTFYFDCSEKYLKEGMDRFAQFFISPLMKREAMTREREVINSEFEMALSSDANRREQIMASFAPPHHPSGKFLWGNLTTLRDNVDDNILYEKVHEFRRRHYSGHRMTVAVQGRLPLDTLEEYVKSSFSSIYSNFLPPDDFSSHANSFGAPADFNKIVWIKPIKDICQVHLTWVLPSYMKEYKSRPLDYISWLVGHEGEGSLLSFLRKKVWALACEAGNDESGFEHNSIYSLFSTTLTLTEEGYEHINEVITMIFSYLSMLKKHCPNKEIYNELRTICDINFRYKTEIPSSSYVEILAESMQVYEPVHYLVGGELYLQYKPEVISEVLNYLTPNRVNVIIYNESYQSHFYDRIEPWFNTKFRVEEIPADWKKHWLQATPQKEFHLPEPNQYVPTDFSLIPRPLQNPPYPVKILDDSLLELWYRQDTKFKQPWSYYSFYLVSPIIRASPLNTVLLDVLTAYLEAKLTEHVYPANQAGLYCSYNPGDLGLLLQFNGYSEKLPLLLDEILKLIHDCCREINNEGNEKLFSAIKKGRSRSYYNKFLKPKKLVKMVRLSVLIDSYWTTVEFLELMNDVTLEKLHNFAKEFFKNIKVLGLIQGNISKKNSLEMCQKFKLVLHCHPLKEEKPYVKVTKLRPGELYLRVKSFNEADSNSVVVNYYQVGQGNIRTSCLIDLLTMVMDEPLFDSLRTKQQIGYDVHCLLRDTFGVLAFSVTVIFQADKFSPDDVDERIEFFLKNFQKKLKLMPQSDWEETKESLIALKSSADLQLQDEVKRNFAEICSGEYIFDRLQQEIEAIPGITQRELCDWFADHISSGKNFKKLSVQVVGDSVPGAVKSEENIASKTYHLITLKSEKQKKKVFITDLAHYKNSREFYPPKKQE